MHFNTAITIGDRLISEGSPTFVIAEAGVNHGGDLDLAKKLIDIAVQAKADAVKFQTFKAEHLILRDVPKAPYQLKTTSAEESQYTMLERLEVSKTQNKELQNYCRDRSILFLTTPFDEYSLQELDELELPAYKIASTDITNLPFLKKVAQRRRPIILSTGMAYMSEVELALAELYPINKDIILLQCSANYPIEDDDAHLNVISTYKQYFDILVGYSDHSVGIGAAPYAVPLGAKVIEKHFTLDKTLEGPDHRASLSPVELTQMIQQIRQVERYCGSYTKVPSPAETKTRRSLQKCLVAARAIAAGQELTEADLVAKRTGGIGLSPLHYRRLIGRLAKRSYAINDIIEEL